MSNDWIAEFLPKLTDNGARSLKNTLEWPVEHRPPDGAHPVNISTGLGKYTHLSWLGVTNSLIKLGMVETRNYREPGGWQDRHWNVLTERGLEVAEYLHAHWDEVIRTVDFRDFCGRR